MELVRVLATRHRMQYKDDPDLLAAWERARKAVSAPYAATPAPAGPKLGEAA
jgi:hypothetical protein